MRTFNLNNTYRIIFPMVIILAAGLFLQSCAKKITFSSSPVVPGAEGWVKVKKDKNNNYGIELKVIRLADSKKLTPPREVYVVWMETAQNGTKNIGKLNTSSSMLSKALKSSLKTVSSFKPTVFFITAEDRSDVETPGAVVVLSTSTF